MKVLNFGSLNLDYVYKVDHMVREGETLASRDLQTVCGGKGLNQSVALARAGVPVFHAGLIGPEGGVLREELSRAGADVTFVKTIPGRTGHTVIQVDREGKNCILLFGGANREVTERYANEVLEHFGAGDVLLLQNEISCGPYLMKRAGEKGMKLVFNPSPFEEEILSWPLENVSLFLVNETEGAGFAALSGGKAGEDGEPEQILRKMGSLFPQADIVLTLGEKGSLLLYRGKMFRQEAFPVKAVDTTGAGDTFTGYFAADLLAGKSAEEALRTAALASAIAVTRKGAAPSIPERKEVENIQL